MTRPLLAAGLNTRCSSLCGIGDDRTIPALEAIRPNLRACVRTVFSAVGVRFRRNPLPQGPQGGGNSQWRLAGCAGVVSMASKILVDLLPHRTSAPLEGRSG